MAGAPKPTIVAGYDGTAAGEAVVKRAADECRLRGARLVLVREVDDPAVLRDRVDVDLDTVARRHASDLDVVERIGSQPVERELVLLSESAARVVVGATVEYEL